MEINKNIPLGAVHIKLPFKSMDDVEFSGTYAPLADKLVDTLRDHLAKHTEPNTDEEEDSNTDETEPEQAPPDEEEFSRQLVKQRLMP